MYTQVLTPIENVCEILIYGNTVDISDDTFAWTEFGAANKEVLLKVNQILLGEESISEADSIEIRKVWDEYLMEEFGLTDLGFNHFVDILNAF